MNEFRMPVRALVVDDEAPARGNLKALLRGVPDIELAGECDGGAAGLAACRELRPDLLFLDIQMPECDGFDLLEMLGGDAPPAIVFVTAYDRHALRAFEVGALDYLLKPFSDERFHVALARARDKLQQRAAPVLERLVLKNAGQVLFLPLAEIDWIAAADYYVSLHAGGRTHLLRRSLADLERDLPARSFCRIHRSTMINLARLQAIETGADGECEAVLTTGVRLRVSKRYRKALQEQRSSPGDR